MLCQLVLVCALAFRIPSPLSWIKTLWKILEKGLGNKFYHFKPKLRVFTYYEKFSSSFQLRFELTNFTIFYSNDAENMFHVDDTRKFPASCRMRWWEGSLDARTHRHYLVENTRNKKRKKKEKIERENLWNFFHFKLPRWKIIYEYLVAYKNTLHLRLILWLTMSLNKVTFVSPPHSSGSMLTLPRIERKM